ncbi:MAG: magnesium transporter CorA family protein [Candidatus Pacebacteria bacterium]|nr:magnesium transporter CorA family protein [Candidatus Paceibacterota bacterium]
MAKYKKISNKIDKIIIDNPKTAKEKITWYNIVSASKKEIEFLRKKFNFQLKHLQASTVKATSQRPYLEVCDGYLFLILHFPIFEKEKIFAGEIDFFIGHGYLITIHNKTVPSLNNFFNSCRKDENSLLSYNLESSSILLYEILQKLMSENYALLDKNSVEINEVDQILFSQEARKLSYEILKLKRNILNLRKIIQNHKNTLKKLMEMESSIVPKKQLKKYYVSLVEHSKRIWEITENQKEHIDALYATAESLMNYRISNIMKILTLLSVIVLPLNLLASIFGMNFNKSMPMIGSNYGFWIMITLMSLSSLTILLIFAKKKWL